MKFNMNEVVLWLKNGSVREVKFERNKVNVITGDSNTGKTAILEIIDYCFFSSTSKISESVINENVLWYGINFDINDKKYTIARKALVQGKVSDTYYFSSSGDIPVIVEENNSGAAIKSILETEFGIDADVAIPYGSSTIRAGTKISVRYFLLFNSISGNTIENDSGVFFDKQNESRYRDALPRIFDLAIGIETVENILKKEKKNDLELKLRALVKKGEIVKAKSEHFLEEKEEIVKRAKEYSLIDSDLDFLTSLKALDDVISGIREDSVLLENDERDRLEAESYSIKRKIRNLKRFTSEYMEYKNTLKKVEDSLKPIEYLAEKDKQVLKTSIFDELVSSFSEELLKIREHYVAKTPIDKQVNDAVRALEVELEISRKKLSITPDEISNFGNDREKFMFLGETKSKIDLYSAPVAMLVPDNAGDIDSLEREISSIDVIDTQEKKDLTIKMIEEIIEEYIEITSSALENYAKYRPVFDYKNKSLLLRKSKTSFIENIGSSSNHMFLHLFFSLANQEASYQNKSPFVAPYLIIDQPSRPYYGNEEIVSADIDHSDESKITSAFELLDTFIGTRNSNSEEFQMIVFEHVPKKIFEDMKHVVLVEEFRNGNALIPEDMVTSQY
jgi:hypothetical protein